MPIFYSPIGEPHERKPGLCMLPGWINASPFAKIYFKDTSKEAYHTGLDLNRNTPRFDMDAHSPVWSISGTPEAPGVVTYSARHSSGWGWIVIARYPTGPGTYIYARFAHLEDVLVKAGDKLYWDTRIGSVGRIGPNDPYHLHFDLSPTEILVEDPGHWPKKNLNLLLQHYIDPARFIQEHAVEGDPEPTPMVLYVQPAGGLRLRAQPSLSATILRTVAQNERVDGFEARQVGAILWRRVRTAQGEQGWMGDTEGAADYLQPTRVGPPPIPTGLTPYDGKVALWTYHPTAASLDAFVDSLPFTVNAVFVKTSNGADWQAANDNHPALGVTGPARVAEWVATLAKQGIDFHAWAVLNGLDVDGEAQRLIAVCNVPGVRSLILDIEPHNQFWSGPREAIRAIMLKVRAAIPADFHIGLSIDPRPQHYAAIFPDEWQPFVDSVHPQVYWRSFVQPYATALAVAYDTWAAFGKPIIPVLQGDAEPGDIVAARKLAATEYKAAGQSFWRLGVMNEAQLAAIADAPLPEPEPVETLETTARLNVRPKPVAVGKALKVLEAGALVQVQGHYTGTGAKDWGRLPSEPVEAYAARDFMRVPVIVVPPKPKVKYYVWAYPHLNIRSEPDLQAPDIGDLAYGTDVLVEEIGVLADTWRWGKIGDGQFVAIEAEDGDPKLLDRTPPPARETPELDQWTLGIHNHEGDQVETDGRVTDFWLLKMAEEGLITGIHIINNFGLARAMFERGCRVSFRRQLGPGDRINEQITGTPTDIELGIRLARSNINMDTINNLPRGVGIQPYATCEANLGKDGYLFLGYAQAFLDMGVPLVAFTNSYGTPAHMTRVNNRFVLNDVWKNRVDSGVLAFLMKHKMYACYNAYGRARHLVSSAGDVVGAKETDDYGCALWPDGSSDDEAWTWFAGYWDTLWKEAMPADCRPMIINGEAGSSAARIATLGGRKSPDGLIDLPGPGGLAALAWDLFGYARRFRRSEYTVETDYWTRGGDGGGDRPKGLYGFAYSSWDRLIPELYPLIKVERAKYAKKRAA